MDRKEEQVRRLLDTPHPAVATDLAARAADRGRRLLRRRRSAHLVLWVLLLAAVITAVVLLAMWWPTPDPLDTTPSTGF
jgi:ferric-dicitrate binding protein FerR (iron transport regulator)